MTCDVPVEQLQNGDALKLATVNFVESSEIETSFLIVYCKG